MVGTPSGTGGNAQLRSRRAEQAKPAPGGVVEAIDGADIVLIAPSNPVVSVGAILAVPGIRGALRTTAAKVVGLSPRHRRKTVARHG